MTTTRDKGSDNGVLAPAAIVALLIAAAMFLAAGAAGCGDSEGREATTRTSAITTSAGAGTGKRPVLLMLHSGAFVFDDPAKLAGARDLAASSGFRPIYVDYPLADLPAAVRASKRVARRYGRGGRAVYGYGESAGGTLAALLAERGLVNGAATYSQVTDIRALIEAAPDPAYFEASLKATPRQIARSSPDRGRSQVRLLALTPLEDDPAQNRATHRWARRNPLVSARDVPGGHLGHGRPPEVYSSNEKRAISWLARRAAADDRPPRGR